MKYFRISVITVFLFWISIFVFIILEGFHQNEITFKKLAIQKAEKNFLKDISFRKWVTSHGGVYVPATASTPPNKYLKTMVKERDVRTPSGKKLTLMNPAYAIRQIMTFYEREYGIKGKITSLKPINPLNTPSGWEAAALRRLHRGEKRIIDFKIIGGIPNLAFMKPLFTTKGCLRCHGYQGYKPGDIRGAIAVYFSLKDLKEIRDRDNQRLLFSYLFIWGIGCILITLGSIRIHKGMVQKQIHLHKLQNNLLEKETLIKEVHHRVKNNLQVISSLINLQLHKTDRDDKSRDTLGKTSKRIEAIANIHEMLYKSENLKDIEMAGHFQTIFRNLHEAFITNNKRILFTQKCNGIRLDIHTAIPLGLIANEILTNSLKHAFQDREEGKIHIELHRSETGEYTMEISDDGPGIPDTLDLRNLKSLGMSLIFSLAQQLGGTVSIERKNGTTFLIRFPG